jgi:hypothetical protein
MDFIISLLLIHTYIYHTVFLIHAHTHILKIEGLEIQFPIF